MDRKTQRVTAECKLTDRQYRKYMNFHVLGNHRDVAKHSIACALIVLFGLINFRTASPVLGWIFVTLGVYLFISRFIRFYMSVNRIIHQFGLSEEPKFFYMLSFSGSSFTVQNATEKADYEMSRIHHVYDRKKESIIYLYLTKANAFLLPYDSFTSGSPGELKKMIEDQCGHDIVTVLENK